MVSMDSMGFILTVRGVGLIVVIICFNNKSGI